VERERGRAIATNLEQKRRLERRGSLGASTERVRHRLLGPRRSLWERPLWQILAIVYAFLALVVGTVIALTFAIAGLAS
jgi:hypothetical protein